MFSGFDKDQVAETETQAILWKDAQMGKVNTCDKQPSQRNGGDTENPDLFWKVVYTNASWKDKDLFSRQRWQSILQGTLEIFSLSCRQNWKH